MAATQEADTEEDIHDSWFEPDPATLKGQLTRLESLRELGTEFGLDDVPERADEPEQRVLREFYSKNDIAREVSRGKASYVRLIEPIEEKYGTIWRRIWIPRNDPTFNNEVNRVLTSMNDVGVSYVDPVSFTTDTKRKRILIADGIALAFGGVIALTAALAAYSAQHEIGWLPGVLLGEVYVGMKPIHTIAMKQNLVKLHESATKTDEYIREHYL